MIKKYTAQGIELLVDESDERVFHPHPITHMLANAIKVKPTDTVLEVGCGSGFIAMTAAKLGAKHVYASDIATPAVQTTLRNKKLNGIDGQMTVVQGDWFAPFKGMKFDVIVANPPCMPFPEGETYLNQDLTLAVNGGHTGTDSVIAVLQAARNYLAAQGVLYLSLAHWSDWRQVMSVARDSYLWKNVNAEKVPYYLAASNRNCLKLFRDLRRRRLVIDVGRSNVPTVDVHIIRMVLKPPTQE
jgi:release factor glutamine methyltransferase